MSDLGYKPVILEDLQQLRSLSVLKKLICTDLNYDYQNKELPPLSIAVQSHIYSSPLLLASAGSEDGFHVIYIQLKDTNLSITVERGIVNKLLQEHPYALFVFANNSLDDWHFINVKHEDEITRRKLYRRIRVSPHEQLRTAAERFAIIDTEEISKKYVVLTSLNIQIAHDEAFDVEKVTKAFFSEYEALFGILETDLKKQTGDRNWAHDFSLQLLNRIMFLYFIQRKGWLGNSHVKELWKAYRKTGAHDEFVEKWLKVLFFKAFNNGFHGGYAYFPQEIRNDLALAPYLNGGLFIENQLDKAYPFIITDSRFEQIFTFVERYNFTIAEDSPLDKEVAVDPEMIGKVYESLVNVSEEIDSRGEAGIFYTPRTEIDLMCRLTLVDYLNNHLDQNNKNLLYEMVFAFEADEKVSADDRLSRVGLWPEVSRLISEITVADPACGSGSFLVGMLNILDDLTQRANARLGKTESPFERKKRIIGQSLYGVDVMEWACHVSELRLWLSLVVDAEFSREELHARLEPLLPHFSFKIRCGDSLVQEVGGINLSHIATAKDISPTLHNRINALKLEKLRFYNNDPVRRFNSIDTLKQEERNLFNDILFSREHELEEKIKSLRRKIEGPQDRQIGLDGSMPPRTHQMNIEALQLQKDMGVYAEELERVKTARSTLAAQKEVPFVWDIAFVEIFEGDAEGFDIVIGNPPYVRQESIEAPHVCGIQITADKKEYKDKLARAVYQAYPDFFGYNASNDTQTRKIDAKSDLYIYFYFRTLRLLNSKGSFCFITSNSWLDVGYGADLQEFLLKHSHVKLILDNQAKRTFANADINSVIVVFAPPDDKNERGLNNIARFVMFKVPFDYIVSPIVFGEIEGAGHRKVTPEYRVLTISQNNLLEEGYEITDVEDENNINGIFVNKCRYIGNKWGGKYLRSPDILQVITNKSIARFQTLGSTKWMVLGRGRRTGADKFFYINKNIISEYGIEKEFVRPLIKSPTQFIDAGPATSNLPEEHFVFVCTKSRSLLRGTGALDYIRWGEQQGFDEGNLARIDGLWWNLGEQRHFDIILPIAFNDRFFAVHNDAAFEVHQRFATLRFKHTFRRYIIPITAFLNSTLTALEAEVFGRRNLGQGALDFPPEDWKYVIVPNPEVLGSNEYRALENSWLEIKTCAPQSIQKEIHEDSKKKLDGVVFDILGLTCSERNLVYEAVFNLVDARLNKANSLNDKERKKREKAMDYTRGIWKDIPSDE